MIDGDPPPYRKDYASWSIDDKIYIHGGRDNNDNVFDDMWVYDIYTNQWNEIEVNGIKPSARFFHSAARFSDGTVFIVGGLKSYSEAITDAWLYDPATSTFTEKAKPPYSTYTQGMFTRGYNAYVLNMYGIDIDKMMWYNFEENVWSIENYSKSYPNPGWIDKAAYCDAKENGFYIIGGQLYSPETGYSPTSDVYSFDPEEFKWSSVTNLPLNLYSSASVYDEANKRILLFGGKDNEGNYINSTYQYSFIPTSVEDENSVLPSEYLLNQNYPNPFNPSTKISFSLPKATNVRLQLYDLLGRCIDIIVDKYYNAGKYTIDYDGSMLASGIYFYRLDTEEFTTVKKMSVVK